MTKTYYTIAIKNYKGKDNCDFVSELSHEFEGETEVISYTDLDNAIFFNTEEDAKNELSAQPEWVQREHIVVEFKQNTWERWL